MKLLIAEDEPDLNQIIVKKLQMEGYEVDSCDNGEDALFAIQYGEYDVAILDIMMPKMDGIETVVKLRSQKNITPVIFLTAKDTIRDKVTGLNMGANDYIVKPFSFEELIARIRSVTRTAYGSLLETLSIDNLTVDLNTHEVRRNGQVIEMTMREYRLLEYLLINKEKVLSRAKIENHVWGFDYEGGTNVVDVYMSYLRKKIDIPGKKKLIHTVRGIGFIIKVDET